MQPRLWATVAAGKRDRLNVNLLRDGMPVWAEEDSR
jgi:hypothetical protein